MKRFLAAWAVTVAFLLCAVQAHAAATQLPPGMQCFQATTGINGMVGTLGTITGGSGGTTGTYAGVTLTGGSGSGATANVTVAGGTVTSVAILNPGIQYVVGDTLSAASGTIGGTTGFSTPVASVAINSSLAGGTVAFYVPNTNTFKQTWKNAAQSVLNTNPVTLDQNGCAIIYGTGTYRQVLQDSLSNTVWDQTTTDVSANNSTFWAGVAAGTPNVITLVDPGFNATDGSIINFTALSTNTSAATLNASGTGAFPILKDTTAGPVALIGGEIIANNPISVIYRSADNSYHLLNTVIASASGATAPLCGAIGLKIVNDTGTPNSVINLTADQIVMQTTAGITINRANVSLLTINTTVGTSTSTANGMDGESPGISQWLNIWAIDNGAAPAGLISTSATAPTMPGGYTYRCRLGAMKVDGSGLLFRTVQLGSRGVYLVTAASNTAALPSLVNNVNVNTAFPTIVSINNTIPPTATRINLNMYANAPGAANQSILFQVAPNGIYGSSFLPCGLVQGATAGAQVGFGGQQQCDLLLEGGLQFVWGVTYGVSNAGNQVLISTYGWTDKVNAN